MNRVLRLPGQGCRFWLVGRCVYEERLNPGLDQAGRCAALREYEDRLDAFAHQAESFGLSDEEAGRIWTERMARSLDDDWECPDFLPEDDGTGETMCGNFADGLCILRLPRCPGRCRRFVLP